jgi:SPP1 family predicted phage head-tail adaptor
VSEKIPAIGVLREKVQLLNKVMNAETEGGHVSEYVPLASVWAKVKSAKGHALFENDARGVMASHEIVMRFRGDVFVGDRVIYRGENLEVLSVQDLNGRRAYIKIYLSKKSVVG